MMKNKESNVKSAYIHIPFCKSICSYCDFCKIIYNSKYIDSYLNALEQEINNTYKNEILKTIYIGGGTPSALTLQEINKLLNILKTLKKENDYEYTIECNINDIEENKIKLFKIHDINRISIGIETINKDGMMILERENNKEDIIRKMNIIKKYFNNINIDLIYGYKNETLEDLKKDLDFITLLNPTHISIYSLIIEEHTKLYINNIGRVDEDLDYKMYKYIEKYLELKGYIHYEISNYSKRDYESKHNLTYWHNEKYYGFGMGASGFIENYRYTNTKSIRDYINGKTINEKEIMTENIMMENEMMLNLRLIEGIKKVDFFNKYSRNINDVFDIINLQRKKLLEDKNGYIKIPKDKLYIENQILMNFIGAFNEKDR